MQSPDTQAVPEHPTAAFASQDFSGCDRCQTTRGNTNAAFRGRHGFVLLLTSLAIPRDTGSPCGCPSSPYEPSRASFQSGVREARGPCLQKPHDFRLPPRKPLDCPTWQKMPSGARGCVSRPLGFSSPRPGDFWRMLCSHPQPPSPGSGSAGAQRDWGEVFTQALELSFVGCLSCQPCGLSPACPLCQEI